MTTKSTDERRLDRKLQALAIDMQGECTSTDFLAMCERYDDLYEQRQVFRLPAPTNHRRETQ